MDANYFQETLAFYEARPLLALIFAAVLVGAPMWGVIVGSSGKPFPRFTFLWKGRRSAPQIGYKKAVLLQDSFMGLVGTPYEVDAVAAPYTFGFHAYSTLEKALSHQQEGTVFLEVLLSGRMYSKEQGIVAQKQRVLQILPGSCSLCEAEPVAFSLNNPVVLFLCEEHRQAEESHAKLALPTTLQLEGSETSSNLATIPLMLTDIATSLPWLSEGHVVVATQQGPSALVPTKV